jgi:hypothetical protein
MTLSVKTINSPVFATEPLVCGEQVIKLLDVGQTWEEHQNSSIHHCKLRRLIWGREKYITVGATPINQSTSKLPQHVVQSYQQP